LLSLLQGWVSEPRLSETQLVVLTRNAVAVVGTDPVDARQSSLWGLVRSAQLEHPDRGLRLLDIDAASTSRDVLGRALSSVEAQLAVRAESAFVPRLARATPGPLSLPAAGDWSLQAKTVGTLEGLGIRGHERGSLGAGEVRVSVRAAGVNFRDVLATLGMYPGDPGPLGYEGSGVVEEVGSAVTDLSPGDPVMGLFSRGFGPTVVEDRRRLVKIPAGLTFEQAAAVPLVFLTAYYALVDLAGLQQREKVLIHAAAGGVGLAAVQLAQHLGAEVYGTAAEGKWWKLREQGLPQQRVASSRSLDFEEAFRSTSGGGVDEIGRASCRERVY
jgi:mycoketide-CoA synthase